MHPQSLYDALVQEHERAAELRARDHLVAQRRRERSLATTSTTTSTPASARRRAGRRTPRARAAAV